MASKSVENPPVKEGQVWRDNDPRTDGRLIEIVKVSNGFIRVKTIGSNLTTRVSKSRFARSSAKRGFTMLAERSTPVAPAPPTSPVAQEPAAVVPVPVETPPPAVQA